MVNFVRNGPIIWGTHGYNVVHDFGSYGLKPTRITLGLDNKVGVNNTQWQYQIANHLNATTAYTRSAYEISSLGYYFGNSVQKSSPHNVSTTSGWDYLMPAFVVPSSLDVMVNDIALKKLKRKIDKAVGDFNVLVPIGELKDLRGTLATSYGEIKRLLLALNAIKHGKIPRGDILKNAAEVWLNFSFGINPMINDVKDIMSSIESFNNRKNSTIHFRGAHSESFHSSTKVPTYSPIGGINIGHHSSVSHTISYRYIAAIRFSLLSGNNYGIAEHLHFSPTEIIPVLWELLPWSWLFDYVSTTGDYFSDMFESKAGNTLYVVKNRRYTANFGQTTFINSLDFETHSNIHFRSVPLVGRRYEFSRESLAQIPHRAFRFKTFDEITGDPYLAKKLLNLASIAALR
jgi:hypothetical protein